MLRDTVHILFCLAWWVCWQQQCVLHCTAFSFKFWISQSRPTPGQIGHDSTSTACSIWWTCVHTESWYQVPFAVCKEFTINQLCTST